MTKRSVAIQVLTILPSLLGAPCGCLAGWPEGVKGVGRARKRGHSFVGPEGPFLRPDPSSAERRAPARSSRHRRRRRAAGLTARSGLDGASPALDWLGLGGARRLPVSRAGGEHRPGNAGGLGGLCQRVRVDACLWLLGP